MHNFRDTLQPPSYPDQWFCMRLKLVTGVVNKTHPECRFTYSEIMKACKQKQYHKDFIAGQAEFFDLKHGWPMKNPLNVTVPLTEDDDWPTIKDTALFVRKSTYVKMIAEKQVGSAASQARLCQINIANNKVNNGESYNFFDAVTNGEWYGFRAILNTDFRSICGGDNMLMNMENPMQSMDYLSFGRMNREQGFERISDCFDFEALCKTYNTKSFDPPNLPPCLKYDCFKYRNADGDRLQPEGYEDTRPFSPDQAPVLPSGDTGGISRPQPHSCIRTIPSSNPDNGEVSDEDAVEDARGENLMDSDGESEVSSLHTYTRTVCTFHPLTLSLAHSTCPKTPPTALLSTATTSSTRSRTCTSWTSHSQTVTATITLTSSPRRSSASSAARRSSAKATSARIARRSSLREAERPSCSLSSSGTRGACPSRTCSASSCRSSPLPRSPSPRRRPALRC